jgi:hypothetical protein
VDLKAHAGLGVGGETVLQPVDAWTLLLRVHKTLIPDAGWATRIGVQRCGQVSHEVRSSTSMRRVELSLSCGSIRSDSATSRGQPIKVFLVVFPVKLCLCLDKGVGQCGMGLSPSINNFVSGSCTHLRPHASAAPPAAADC